MPSIVDPSEKRGGAWAVTSGLIKAMESAWPECSIECIATASDRRPRHLVRQSGSVAASLIAGGLPAKMRFVRTRSMRTRINAAMHLRRPDLVVLNGGDLLWARSELPSGVPVVVVAHNLEHRLYRRQIANLPVGARFIGWMLSADAHRLQAAEIEGLRAATAAIFLSEEDLSAVRSALGDVRTVVIPPIFDYKPLPRQRVRSERLRIGLFADFEWWPNRVGLDWFLAHVWPEVSRHCELHLLGHGSENAGRGVDGVVRHGFLNEAREGFAACDLMIAPITDGAGIKVKVAEALYNRVPVVATPAAVSGIFTVSNPALRVCEDARDWINFLTSPDALRLADEEVPASVRDAFTVKSAAERIRTLWEA